MKIGYEAHARSMDGQTRVLLVGYFATVSATQHQLGRQCSRKVATGTILAFTWGVRNRRNRPKGQIQDGYSNGGTTMCVTPVLSR